MIQVKPYEFMTKYTPQTEWIRGGGIFICIAFFAIELGGGTFVFSSIFSNLLGMATGFVLTALGTLFFLVHLGRPVAAIRAVLKPQNSWISRGVLFISTFLILAFISIVLLWFKINPPVALLAITGIIGFFMMIYAGFAMNSVNGIPFWNTPLVPILLAISGSWAGAEITLATSMLAGSFTTIAPQLEEFIRILLVFFIFIFAVYMLNARFGAPAGQASVKEIVSGKSKWLFWIVIVVLGVIFPLAVVAYSFVTPLEIIKPLLILAVITELVGDFTLRYLIMRNAFYSPLTPV